ncbi:hypothetical protein BOX15_Mlig031854g1, partial [Macrostomum lignano]
IMSDQAAVEQPNKGDATDAGSSIFKRSSQVQPAFPQPLPTAALEDIDAEYQMGNPSRGFCLIFNHVNFLSSTHQPTREGSDVDASSIENSFRRLGFDVRTFRDLTASNLLDVLREFRLKNHSNNDCFAVVLLSHGYEGHFYAKDRDLPIDFVVRQFKPDACKTLAGKPKLFFIQACRGDNFDRGVEVTDGEDDTLDALPPAGVGVGSGAGISGPFRVPLESDFFFFYSTPPGYFSWRNSHRGSWFGQQLTALLDRHGDRMELQHLMLMVQRLVSSAYASDTGDPKSTGMKQMPVTVSQLRKLLYFRPKQH